MGIKLSISNIAWEENNDDSVYTYLQNRCYDGIEIAPSKIFGALPYEDLQAAICFRDKIKNDYKLNICSIQSIWFGKTEKMFASAEDRKELKEYTKKAIVFAEAIGAGNLVFGCPKNRNINSHSDRELAIDFFKELGEYANYHNTVLSLEANPKIYGTNYINFTKEAIDVVRTVDSDGFKLNLDFGTIIENGEDLVAVEKNIDIINHVHISEPHLNLIEERAIHCDLIRLLEKNNYDGYVSIEMKKQEDIALVYKTIDYLVSITKEL